jgi:hypothetical protein
VTILVSTAMPRGPIEAIVHPGGAGGKVVVVGSGVVVVVGAVVGGSVPSVVVVDSEVADDPHAHKRTPDTAIAANHLRTLPSV